MHVVAAMSFLTNKEVHYCHQEPFPLQYYISPESPVISMITFWAHVRRMTPSNWIHFLAGEIFMLALLSLLIYKQFAPLTNKFFPCHM